MKTRARHVAAYSALLTSVALASLTLAAPGASADSQSSGTDRTRVTKGTAPSPVTHVTTDGDTYANAAHADTAYGTTSDIRVGASDGPKNAYLHFTIPAEDVGRITSASLVLTRTEHHLPSTTISVGSLSGAWQESTLTATSAPAPGAVLGTRSVSATTNDVTFDVTSAVVGKTSLSLAVTSPITTDVAIFRSRESGSNPPSLMLTTDESVPTTGSGGSGSGSGTNCAVSAKLVPSCQVWLGVTPQAYSNRITSQPARLAVDEAFTGRKFDIFHEYFTNGQLFPDSASIARANEGRTLSICWKPSTGMSWRAIADGKNDSVIDKEAAYLKANFNRPFFLTIYHEPEDNVKLAAGSGFTPADYVAMYRHTVQRLRAQGATMFISVMNYMGYFHWDSMRNSLYPGDDVVDWIAWDPYTFNAGGGPGQDFTALVNTAHGSSPGFYDWATKTHPGKPLMLAEWGVMDQSMKNNPLAAAQFFPTVVAQLPRFPALKALDYFTMERGDTVAGQATSPDETPAGLAAWRVLAQAPIFNKPAAATPPTSNSTGRYRSSRIGRR